MRPIKFKAWDKKYKRWLNLDGEKMNPLTGKIMYDADNSCSDPECCGGPRPYWQDNDDIEVVQYIGLKDKNSVEIFEGDIILGRRQEVTEGQIINIPINSEVVWSDGQWLALHPVSHQSLRQWYAEGSEVIGNIYENEELLK